MPSLAKNWHRADIGAAIHKKGSSLLELGRLHGYAYNSMGVALSMPSSWPRCKIIADFLGVSVHELWPEWFDERGNRTAYAQALIAESNSKRKFKHRRNFTVVHSTEPIGSGQPSMPARIVVSVFGHLRAFAASILHFARTLPKRRFASSQKRKANLTAAARAR